MAHLFDGAAFQYPEHHLSEATLHALRHQCDALADRALEAMLEHCVAEGTTLSSAVDALLGDDPSLLAQDARVGALLEQVHREPAWLDWSLLARGQQVYLAHAVSASMGLLYQSLLGGFSAPRIVSVLECTRYLMTDEHSTCTRVLETQEMLIDCAEHGAMRPLGRGWATTIRVRLLHSRTRRHILRTSFDVALNGIPINEEDMVITLLSFSVMVIDCLERVGTRVSEADQRAFMHWWRYVGYLIGVGEENNPCHDLRVARGVHPCSPPTRLTGAQAWRSASPRTWSCWTVAAAH